MIKVHIVCAKKAQRSNLSWNWKGIRNLDLNRLVVSKLASGIWQNLTRTLKVSKIFISVGSYWAKYILFELKKKIGIIFHATEEGHTIWREIDLSFQNWHNKFGLLLSKLYIAWAKKSVRELSFTKLKRDTKFVEESSRRFKIGIKNFKSTQKSQKFSFSWAPFEQIIYCLS